MFSGKNTTQFIYLFSGENIHGRNVRGTCRHSKRRDQPIERVRNQREIKHRQITRMPHGCSIKEIATRS